MTALEIDAFLEVARTGSITAAAQRLYVTQPALSRRLHTLEEELGYPLFLRGRGRRAAGLTPQGQAFVAVAERWRSLWEQAKALGQPGQNRAFDVASVGSVSTYLLPEVFRLFLEQHSECGLNFHHYHSDEAYRYTERGECDLALISDDQFSREVQTIPLFREPMLLAAHGVPGLVGAVHPTQLDGGRAIKLPWNPEYARWHSYWFGADGRPKVFLDQMSLMEHFLREPNTWVVAPLTAARRLARGAGAELHPLQEGPPPRVIYAIAKRDSVQPYREQFLALLAAALGREEGVEVFWHEKQDFLGQDIGKAPTVL